MFFTCLLICAPKVSSCERATACGRIWVMSEPWGPRCRAPVLREGKNNHLRCYACMTQFCVWSRWCRCGLPMVANGCHECHGCCHELPCETPPFLAFLAWAQLEMWESFAAVGAVAKARCFEVLPKGKASEHFNKLRICPQHSDD